MNKEDRKYSIMKLRTDLEEIGHAFILSLLFFAMVFIFSMILSLIISNAGGVLLFSTLLSVFLMLYWRELLACIEDKIKVERSYKNV